jgi:hypothetical protein
MPPRDPNNDEEEDDDAEDEDEDRDTTESAMKPSGYCRA